MPVAERRTHLDGLAIGLMLTCCVLWGAQQVVVKATLPALSPFLQAAVRSAVAAACLAGWSFARRIPFAARDGTTGPGLVAGALFGLEFLCIYAALPLTTAARVSVFLYLAPFVVALALPLFQPAERLSALQSAGLVGAFLALAYAFQEGFAVAQPDPWRGDALAVLAACLWGATTLVVRTTRLATAAPEKTLLYQLVVSAALLAAVAVARGERWPVDGLPVWAWLSLAFQSIVVAFASYLAWFWLLHRYPATRLSAFSFLTPLFGVFFGAWALHEVIGHRLLIAMLFVAVGIALVNRKPASAQTPARELP